MGNEGDNVHRVTQGKNGDAEIACRITSEDYHNSEWSKRTSDTIGVEK